MKRMLGILALVVTPTLIAAQATTATTPPARLRVFEFQDVRGAVFDSAFTEFRAYLGTRPGFWTYSIYGGDNGSRYLTAPFNTMADITRQDSITNAFASSIPNGEAFARRYFAGWGTVTQTIWRLIPSLSTPPTGMTAAQVAERYPFRRISIRYIRNGMEMAFESAMRDAKAADERLGISVPMMVYGMEIGAEGPAYLVVTYAQNSDAFWNFVEERRQKRVADQAWGDINRRINATQRELRNVSLNRSASLSYLP